MKKHPIIQSFEDFARKRLELETLKVDLKNQIDKLSRLIENEKEVALKSRKICEQVLEGKYCLPG